MNTPKHIPKNAQPFDSLGETYWLSEVTPALRSVYASMVRARARQQLIDDKSFLSPQAYEEEKEQLQAHIDSGAYEWGPPVELGGVGAGKAIRASLNSDAGKLSLFQLLLHAAHGELSPAKIVDIINANPESAEAAFRAAQGLPPLASAPAVEKPGTTQWKTGQAIPAPGAIAS